MRVVRQHTWGALLILGDRYKKSLRQFKVKRKCRRDFLLYYRNHSVTRRTEHPKQVTHFKLRDK